MRNAADREYARRPGFMNTYRAESARMQAYPDAAPEAEKPRHETPDTSQDMAVLLPILLLLLNEGADRWLLLALAYILF